MLLVEDAGLFINALNGFPGVYSSYVLETLGVHGVLTLMEHLRSEDPIQDGNLRSAEFRAVAAIYHNGETTVAKGVCPGRISHSSVEGEGFGFDPIFIPADLDADGEALPVGEMVIKALMALHLVAFLWKKNSTILIVVEPYLAYYPTSTYEGEILVCERFGVS